MSDLGDLYQQMILDHGKRPRNLREIENPDRTAEGYNPLCGDRVTVWVRLNDQTLSDVAFTGSGCAICTASASMMTQAMKGKSEEEAEAMFQAFHDLLAGAREPAGGNGAVGVDLGKLEALAGVRKYPIRVKCATLPWHTLHAALENREEPVSTE